MGECFLYQSDNENSIIIYNHAGEPFFWARESHLPGAIIAVKLQKIYRDGGFATINGTSSWVKMPPNHQCSDGKTIFVQIVALPQKGKGAKCRWLDPATHPNPSEQPATIAQYIQNTISDEFTITTNQRAIWAEIRQHNIAITCHDNQPNPNEKNIIQQALATTHHLDNDLIIHIHETNAGTIIDVDSHHQFGHIKNDNDIIHYNQKICADIARLIAIKSLNGLILIDFLKPKNRALLKNILPTLKSQTKKYLLNAQILGFGPAGLCECTISWSLPPISSRVP